MADKLMRALVTLSSESGLVKDNCVNTFYFDGDDGNSDNEYHSKVFNKISAFYVAIANRISDHIVSPVKVQIYDMRDPTPRVPEFTQTFVLDRSAINGLLPNEVALCLSFQADAVSGIKQARRRGRVYLGPLSNSADIVDTLGELRPGAALINQIAAAATVLATPVSLLSIGSLFWSVYSPTLDVLQTIDDSFNDVTNGWIDDAFDTQRRRGRAATSRTLWT